tara:strand:- start:14320 stop:14598 length:279 start_codon:yes stop_codon:yes gene_type:complete
MSYENLYNLTPRAFWNAVDGYWLDAENKDRKEWIRTRWQTCLLLNVHLPRKNQIRANKLIRFDWEAEDETKVASYEDVKFQYDKMIKRKKVK